MSAARLARAGCAAVALAVSATTVAAQDLDRDGLSDALEQALLERFLPTLVLSAGECDGLPASFVPGTNDPMVAARDGTLYGHVSRLARGGEAVELELKYFHLWGRDCGRPSHALDVEHVSVLIRAPHVDAPPDEWHAESWYAAAHEGTVCDASSGARAETLRATSVGPYVYVSRGKHASYLARGHCKWGCGSDLCDPGAVLVRSRVVNLGEAGAPLNGASWMHSRKWALAAKLAPDFEPSLRARVDTAAAGRVLALRLGLRPVQAPILGGNTGLDALAAAGDAATTALEHTGDAAGDALTATGKAVGTAVSRSVLAVGRFLRLR